MPKKIATYLAISALCLSICAYSAAAVDSPSTKSSVLPTIKLPVPRSPHERAYLGLSGDGYFKIPQIKAQVVIAEIFSMYCPHCQKGAPKVNELYQAIENHPQFKNKIKLIGVGAGNSAYEVEVFKNTYNIPFPLIPDADYTIHKALGEVRTPHFVAVRNHKNGTYKVFYSQVGGFEKADEFLEMIINSSGLKEGN